MKPETDGAGLARLKALFGAVCDLPAAEVAARLAELDATPAELERVQALLREDALNQRLTRPVAALLNDAVQELHAGERLGAYTLLRELGHGGMGQVFLAERSDGHYQQQVAIKLLLGLPGPDAAALLARERQILATLNHPHIARLLDGGTTPRGRPYLVMAYIAGERIDRHCEAHRLGLTERLALFGQVCEAVAEAHRHLVVHCDLKPGNVLVDERGQAHLLDFGVARLQGQDSGGGLTPRYASPEQQAGQQATVSSDIYSLGRMLEELLPAGLPREREWRALIAKATAAEPADRYASVTELQADLARFARHAPLAALPRHWSYVTAKLLRRRWPWALTGTAAVAMTAGFTVSLVQQRDRAEREAATTREVSQFVQSLFEGADPATGQRHDVTALELLNRGRNRIAKELKDQPEQRARLQAVLADVYERLGRFQPAAELFQQSLDSHRPEPAREAYLLARLTLMLSNSGRAELALESGKRAHALLLAQQPADEDALGNIENRLGVALTSLKRFDEAEPLLKRSLERFEKLGDDLATGAVLHNLARLAEAREDLPAAEDYFRRSLTLKLKGSDPDDDLNLDTQSQLASVLAYRGKFDEGIALLEKVRDRREAIWGAKSEHLARALNELGDALVLAGRTRAAATELRHALALEAQLAEGKPSRNGAIARHNLGKALMAMGDPDAEAELRESLAERLRVFGRSDARGVQPARATLARWLLLNNRPADQELDALWQERSKYPPDSAERLTAQLLRIEAAQMRGDWGFAATELVDVQRQAAALKTHNLAHSLRLRAAQARHDGEADLALQLDTQAWAALTAVLPPNHPGRLAPGLAWAERLRTAGHVDEAAQLLRELAPASTQHVPGSIWLTRYRAAVATPASPRPPIRVAG